MRVKIGTQGVVSGVDKWGRFHVWIAEPWVDLYGNRRSLDRISDFSAVRVIPYSRVSDDLLRDTLKSLQEFESEARDTLYSIFPPGFLEFQRRFNQ